MSISIRANQVLSRLPLGVYGQVVDAASWPSAQIADFVNSDPQAVQTYTVVIDTVTNSATYTFTVDGETITYTADSSTSAAEIGAGLLDAVNANGHVRGMFVPSFDTSTLTLTAINPSIDVLASDSDAKLTTTETVAPAAASTVGFGLGIVDLGTTNDVVYASKLAAQVSTITLTQVSSESYGVSITINGQLRSTFVATAGSLALTTTALVTAINNMMDSFTAGTTVVAASSVAGTITLTAEVKGTPFTAGVSSISGLPGTISITDTTITPLTDINRWWGGVSVKTDDTEITTVGGESAAYAPNSGFMALKKGRIFVQSDETPTASNSVYVETLAGDTKGRFYTTASTTRILVPGARWFPMPSRSSGQGLAMLDLG
jgi:hypothetical protein